MASTVRGATLLGADKLEIREYPLPDIRDDGGLVKVERAGVRFRCVIRKRAFERSVAKYLRCFQPKP